MKKIKVNANAKINLTLDVLGSTGNFHEIKSLVTSVDICDEITVRKRKDGRINANKKREERKQMSNDEMRAYLMRKFGR